MYHVGNMKSSSLRALFLTKVFTSDSLRGIACGASARWPPLVCRSSNAKQHGHSSVLAVPRRAHAWSSDHVFAPLEKAFRRNAQPAPARSCSKGAWGMLSPTSKWVIPARGRNDPFSQSVYHSALLATYVRPQQIRNPTHGFYSVFSGHGIVE